jgi:hypothetical protein
VTTLLAHKTDQGLTGVATRAAGLVADSRPETLEQDWANGEIDEWRPPGVRVDVHDASGRLRASAGEGADLVGAEPGCFDQGLVRVCGARAGIFLVLAGVDRSLDVQARNGLIYQRDVDCGRPGYVCGGAAPNKFCDAAEGVDEDEHRK